MLYDYSAIISLLLPLRLSISLSVCSFSNHLSSDTSSCQCPCESPIMFHVLHVQFQGVKVMFIRELPFLLTKLISINLVIEQHLRNLQS